MNASAHLEVLKCHGCTWNEDEHCNDDKDGSTLIDENDLESEHWYYPKKRDKETHFQVEKKENVGEEENKEILELVPKVPSKSNEKETPSLLENFLKANIRSTTLEDSDTQNRLPKLPELIVDLKPWTELGQLFDTPPHNFQYFANKLGFESWDVKDGHDLLLRWSQRNEGTTENLMDLASNQRYDIIQFLEQRYTLPQTAKKSSLRSTPQNITLTKEIPNWDDFFNLDSMNPKENTQPSEPRSECLAAKEFSLDIKTYQTLLDSRPYKDFAIEHDVKDGCDLLQLTSIFGQISTADLDSLKQLNVPENDELQDESWQKFLNEMQTC